MISLRREAMKKVEASERGHKRKDLYKSSEKGKERKDLYESSEKGKRRKKEFFSSEKGREAMKKVEASEKGKKRSLSYETSEKGPKTRVSYESSEKGQTRKKVYEKTVKRVCSKINARQKAFLNSLESDTGFNVICTSCREFKSKQACVNVNLPKHKGRRFTNMEETLY